jgi:hypothetical protein
MSPVLQQKPPDTAPPGIQPAKRIVVDGIAYDRYAIKVPRLIAFGENLEATLNEFVKPHYKPGDWVMISEKLVSISENKVRHISTVKVTWLARFIQKGVKKHKNMTAWDNPAKIQVAIEEAGLWRIIPAIIFGGIGKIFRIRGLFWIIAGSRVSEIDGFTPEDMYPYTEWAVLPPSNAQRSCEEVEKNVGISAVTADANYINVKIVGVSKGVGLDKKTVRLILLDNPIGQGNKMTPFALVRRVR